MTPPVRRRPPIKVTDLSEIMRALGRLEEGQEHMAADIEASGASRGRMHQKLDKLEETVGIMGHVVAQARDETAALKQIIDNDVKPATDDFRRVQSFGKLTLWAVGATAALLGITLATTAETIINGIRHWLRIE